MPEATGEGKTMALKVLRYTVIWIPRPRLVKLHRKPVRGQSMHGASVRLQWLGQVVALALAASAFAQPAEIATDTSNAPFGITLAGPAPAVLPQRLPSIMSHARDLGAAWFRVNVLWACSEPWHGCVEKSEGRLDWSLTDAIVGEAEKVGVSLLLNVRGYSCGTPCDRPNPLYASDPELKLRAYETFIRELVRRYKGRIRHWQIENEITERLFWRGTLDEYHRMLAAAYRVIKAEDAAAQVLLAGVPTMDAHFVSDPSDHRFRIRAFAAERLNTWKAIVAEARDNFDILDLHLYDSPASIPERIELFRRHLQSLGAHKPIWVTETGGPDTRNPAGDPRYFNKTPPTEAHASEVVMRLVLALSAGAERVFWFHLIGSGTGDEFAHVALVHGQEQQLAFSTFRLVARKLAGFASVHSVNAGRGISAYRFSRPAGDVYVLWAAKDSASATLASAGTRVLVTEVDGTTSRLAATSLTTGTVPIFVEPEP